MRAMRGIISIRFKVQDEHQQTRKKTNLRSSVGWLVDRFFREIKKENTRSLGRLHKIRSSENRKDRTLINTSGVWGWLCQQHSGCLLDGLWNCLDSFGLGKDDPADCPRSKRYASLGFVSYAMGIEYVCKLIRR